MYAFNYILIKNKGKNKAVMPFYDKGFQPKPTFNLSDVEATPHFCVVVLFD